MNKIWWYKLKIRYCLFSWRFQYFYFDLFSRLRGWVDVNKRLPHKCPDAHEWVLAINIDEEPEPFPFVVGFTYIDDMEPDFERLKVTHWMYIPKYPKEKSK
jgi:hypothetical protein